MTPSPQNRRNPRNRKRAGFALIFVLLVVALATTMAVLFLASTGRERKGTAVYANGSATLRLGDMAVENVMAHITAATQEGTTAAPVSWASQPGMIRTFKSDGSLGNVYKLYSWSDPNLVEPGGSFNAAAASEQPVGGWNQEPALYVDLNQPVNGVYPIVDPTVVSSGPAVPAYNPTAGGGGLKGVAGFTIDASAPAVASVGGGAPMPVKWLYVLQDGEMVVPGAGGDGASVTVPNATEANPIVGRVAFWTDDESCKVNVNTATEGTYWDWPKTGSVEDVQFAANPPVKNEFQRIPGQPANTSLSAVFQEFRPGYPNDQWTTGFSALLKNIYSLAPRAGWSENGGGHAGGSVGGTYPISSYAQTFDPPFSLLTDSPLPFPLSLPSRRLYATPSELWFQPGSGDGQARPANAIWSAVGLSSPQKLKQREFFLTATSRAPETTLFETPRISLWPITWPHASSYWDTAKQTGGGRVRGTGLAAPATNPSPATTLIQKDPWATVEERLLAFCSTLNVGAALGNQYRYFFQRQDPDSPTSDWNNIPRNQDLVNYLSRLTALNEPGFGGSLATKWGDSHWVPLNCFDYIRSQVNQYTLAGSAQNAAAPGYVDYRSPLTYSYTGTSFRAATLNAKLVSIYTETNAGSVCPLNVTINGNNYVTGGTYPTLKEAAVVFYASQRNEPVPPLTASLSIDTANAPNPAKWANLIDLSSGSSYATQTTKLRAVMLFDFNGLRAATANGAYYGTSPAFWLKVTGGPFTINGASTNLPAAGGASVQWISPAPSNSLGGIPAIYTPLFYFDATKNAYAPKLFSHTPFSSTTAYQYWTLASDEMPVGSTSSTFAFGGSSVTVQLYAVDPTNINKDTTGDSTKLVWTRTIDFSQWSNTLPMPIAPRWNAVSYNNVGGGGTLPPTQPNPAFSAASAYVNAEYVPKMNGLPFIASEFLSLASTSLDSAGYGGGPAATGLVGPLPYVYQGGGNINYVASTGSGGDADDLLQAGEINPSSTRGNPNYQISTNFRKRVAGLMGGAASRWSFVTEGAPVPSSPGSTTSPYEPFLGSTAQPAGEALPLITPYDTVVSMILDPTQAAAGDPRLTNAPGVPAVGQFKRIDQVLPASAGPAPVIGNANHPRPTYQAQWHQLGTPSMNYPALTGYQMIATAPALGGGRYVGEYGAGSSGAATGQMGAPGPTPFPYTPATVRTGSMLGAEFGPLLTLPATGDWTSMPGRAIDGGLLARIDQDYQTLSIDYSDHSHLFVPYFFKYGLYNNGPAPGMATPAGNPPNSGVAFNYFSPNRQVPSPVVLGTIPSSTSQGWQTLAFSPNPAAGGAHPGLQNPPDHLLLDFFWMPVVQPWPLSDQLSTAGKVNLNYAIMPFSYIVRKTGLHALMRSTMITAVPDGAAEYYKSYYAMLQSGTRVRWPINVDETLKGFDAKFSGGDLFRSASQVCEMSLVPDDGVTKWADMGTYWNTRRATSDNAREEPYNHLYSRLTTKSNVFTVHWRVQALRAGPHGTPGVWNENAGAVLGTLQGATVIERYIDPNVDTSSSATLLPDYATGYPLQPSMKPLTAYYKWRTVSENYFQP